MAEDERRVTTSKSKSKKVEFFVDVHYLDKCALIKNLFTDQVLSIWLTWQRCQEVVFFPGGVLAVL